MPELSEKRERAALLTPTVTLSAHDRAFFKRQSLRLDPRIRERQRLLLERAGDAVPRRTAETDATAVVIEWAIRDRACLRGTHVEFRVRFAPHVLGRDGCGRHVVLALEYGGLTLGRPHWVSFALHRLRGLQRAEDDPWRSGPVDSRPQLNLTKIDAAVDGAWVRCS
jgi:hypothetical protein